MTKQKFPGLDAKVGERISALLSLASGKYKHDFLTPRVVYTRNSGRAGSFTPSANRLRINLDLLEEHGEGFLDEIIGHELAHSLVWQLYGPKAKPHGREWKRVMGDLGLPARTTHDYSNSRLKRFRFIYSCNCPKRHRLSAVRHHRIRRANARYLCPVCRTLLNFVGESTN